jgi:cytochrome c5
MRQGLLLCALVVAAGVMSGGWAGASTRTQVDAGLQVYQSRCSRCHGAEMEGGMTAGSWAPALKRADFFQSKNATDFNTLRAYIKRTMPIGEENTLTDEESVNLAHLLRSANGIAADGFAEPAFRQLWETADQPVQRGQARRSWLWGPEGFAVHWEPYDGQPRLVQYFDKTRMEITTLVPPSQPRPDDYVTTGLLATELVSGRLQTGRSTFEERAPAAVTVAGDANDPNGPTYATFRNLTGRVEASQSAVMATVDRAGAVGQNGALGNYTEYVFFVPETGHNIPRVFWDFLKSNETTFGPWWFPAGLPITEAYWARVRVGGVEKDVLVQVFQRRVLTYTPDNDPAFQVEMGNVGRQYHAWRYNS